MLVKIWVCDSCNYKCNDCHWFQEPINIGEPNAQLLLNLISKHPEWDRIVLTGGEPTMWNGFTRFVENIPNDLTVIIQSNGSYPDRIERINRSNLFFVLHIFPRSDYDSFFRSKSIIKRKGWDLVTIEYKNKNQVVETVDVDRIIPNQLQEASRYSYLLGKKIYCYPAAVYVGTDAQIYWCERGLRSKDPKLKRDFGEYNICIVEEPCLSCFVGENIPIENTDSRSTK
jgi:organic radical activating enzyme